jgi:hypothetical protein
MPIPLDQLPLGADEKSILQCAFVWLQTHDTGVSLPLSRAASYSELWYMLQYLEQIQMLIRNLCRLQFNAFVDEHKARYEAAGCECDFGTILYYNFKPLKETLADRSSEI